MSPVTSLVAHVLAVVYVIVLGCLTCVTSVRYRKLCKDSDIQIMSHKGVRIEPYERSRVEITLAMPIDPSSKNKFELDFDFKTTSANGTLFYARSSANPNEVIALVLRNGHLIYKIQCPSLHADVLLSTRTRGKLNDNKWHHVEYTTRFGRHGTKGRIEIDGHSHTKRYQVTCEQITSVVMGGHSLDDKRHRYYSEISGVNGHFQGCISKLSLSYFLSKPPQYYAVSQCPH